MELTLTKKQKQYLDSKGIIPAGSLQKAYKESVREQQDIVKAAKKIREAQPK